MSSLHTNKETPTTDVYNALWLSVDKSNHMKNKQPIRTMEISRGRANEQTSNLTKVRENAGYKVAIGYHWNLIGLKSGASFLDQS